MAASWSSLLPAFHFSGSRATFFAMGSNIKI